MLLLIDHNDSFTHNIASLFHHLDIDVLVIPHEELSYKRCRQLEPSGIVLGPGPGRPEEARLALELVRSCPAPLLGICLGHQAIGHAFGMRCIQAMRVMHGMRSTIDHDGKGVFEGLPPFHAVRYHSLALEEMSCPDELLITAKVADGEVMGIRHRFLPIEGVQFHPDAFETDYGSTLIRNWWLQYCSL